MVFHLISRPKIDEQIVPIFATGKNPSDGSCQMANAAIPGKTSVNLNSLRIYSPAGIRLIVHNRRASTSTREIQLIRRHIALATDIEDNLQPGFQRQSVWSERDRAKLIDSMLRNCS